MKAEKFVKKININRRALKKILLEEGFSPEGAEMDAYLTEKLEKERDITIPGQPELTELLRKYNPPGELFGDMGFTVEENMGPHEAGWEFAEVDEGNPIVALEETGEIVIFQQEHNGGGLIYKLAKDGASFLDVLEYLSGLVREKSSINQVVVDKAIKLAGGPEYKEYYEIIYESTVEANPANAPEDY